jgi:pectinesterase
MKTSTTLYTLLVSFIIILSFLSPSLASLHDPSPNTTCNITPYPSFCTTTLPPNYLSIHDQTLFFIQQSLSITNTIFQLISSYFNQSNIQYSTLLVLQDCLNLSEINIDFLSNVLQAIQSLETNTNTTIMNSNQAYDLQTLLSAVLTNHQTCLDGFHEVNPYPKISTTLSNPLSDGTKLYRISLSFFAQYRVNTVVGRLTDKAIIMNNRKLLQTSVDNVIVTQKVIVNLDGSGDFVTINDAVDAAPNKTGTNNGYHVIYVVAGIYNEYVSIAKSKENLMIVGDGIGRTLITGNRSVVDGWTTFQSATFGKLIN